MSHFGTYLRKTEMISFCTRMIRVVVVHRENDALMLGLNVECPQIKAHLSVSSVSYVWFAMRLAEVLIYQQAYFLLDVKPYILLYII